MRQIALMENHRESGSVIAEILEYFEDPKNWNKTKGYEEKNLWGKKYKVRATVRWFALFKKGRRVRIDLETIDEKD